MMADVCIRLLLTSSRNKPGVISEEKEFISVIVKEISLAFGKTKHPSLESTWLSRCPHHTVGVTLAVTPLPSVGHEHLETGPGFRGPS